MILVVDDDYSITASLSLLLKQSGYECLCAHSPDEAIAGLSDHPITLVLQDMNFSRATTGEEGLSLIKRIKATNPELPVLLITAWGSIELAVAGIKAGAADFITKPWNNDQIIQSVRTALGLVASRDDGTGKNELTRQDLNERYDFGGVIGEDPNFIRILDLIGRVSATDASILITGDSGTGKEVIAEAIHKNSHRREGPFIKVNLGGISTSLFESEMFGHVKGAFTDAMRDRQGRFAKATGGTILLDEIGDLDLRSQVKLLRVLQDRCYEVLGSSETRRLDVRVVAATNRNLPEAVDTGDFREDLFYRINLISVQLPSLEERSGDVPLLAQAFLDQACTTYSHSPATLADSTLTWLRTRAWPGNIRQLKHLIERTILISGTGELTASDFERVAQVDSPDREAAGLPAVGTMTVDEVEKAMILKSLSYHGGNLSRVAESLGLSRAALYRRLEKYGIKS
jgi:DNA-binding NtrC family response regulator